MDVVFEGFCLRGSIVNFEPFLSSNMHTFSDPVSLRVVALEPLSSNDDLDSVRGCFDIEKVNIFLACYVAYA